MEVIEVICSGENVEIHPFWTKEDHHRERRRETGILAWICRKVGPHLGKDDWGWYWVEWHEWLISLEPREGYELHPVFRQRASASLWETKDEEVT